MQKRWKSDKIINASLTEVLRGREWVQLPWSALAVGDIVKVSGGAANLRHTASSQNHSS